MQSLNKQLLVVGAGGHAKVVIDVARAAGWNPVAALDPIGSGHHCAEVPVLGDDDMAEKLFGEGLRFAVVAIGSNRLRARLGDRLQALGFQCPALVHPSATISPYAWIGDGTVVMPGAIINSHAEVGSFAIINTGAIVEHDCRIGKGAHIAPRSVMGGNVDIGDLVLFGIGAVARPETTIETGVTVGAGSVVISRIEAGQTVVGAPAQSKQGSGL